MKIGLFGIQVTENCKSVLNQLVKTLIEKDAQLWIHPFFYELFSAIQKQYKIPVEAIIQSEKIPADLNYLITIGGDGTFLEAVSAINLQKIPLLGVNTGRLGFLADVSPGEIPEAIEALYKNEFRIEERSVIKATLFPEQNITFPFALNDLTVHKRDTSSMIAIQAYIDDVFLSQYWADGLIIATPTGSTAYSMSAGGPIVTPDSKNFIITPIASHNLTVRPLVIPDHHEISLKIESRDSKFLLSLDSRSYVMEEKLEVRVKKAETNVSLVKLNNQHFYKTIRNKLMWGVDKRN
ncbi:MAG: NAD kinase [Bacteroidetes bacterium HGW-Bacteroidetes-4]|nr:MAG: NAD kinase [Bacteroidetes bacterium HGW-Bacteroidetes-4]